MSEELEVLKLVTARLNQAGILYMVSGSVAANYYTIPRMTRDIDIVMELRQGDIDKFVELFKGDFYVDRETVTREVSRQGMFNIIHNQYVIKIDCIIKRSSPYQEAEFLRKTRAIIEQSPIWIVSPEDLVISKLVWAKDSHSEMQLKDVANIIGTVDNLDMEYMGHWIRELGLEQIFKEVGDVRHPS